MREGRVVDERSNDELRAELERVRKERDDYRAMAADMLKRHFNIDLDQFEAEMRDYQENGGIPFSQVIEMLEKEFGIKI
jgi:hypothetical protein